MTIKSFLLRDEPCLKKALILLFCLSLVLISAFFYIKSAVKCADGYIPFDFRSTSYCIAKYEMKKSSDGKTPISVADVVPWEKVPYSESVKLCESLGSNYSLITNAVWTALARDISRNGDNWSYGEEFVGSLNQGHSFSTTKWPVKASPDDNDACFKTGVKCSLNLWAKERRTHKLKNGEIIWDLSGNVSEWVIDNVDYTKLKKEMSITFVNVPNLKEYPYSVYGPEFNCDIVDASKPNCGMGVYWFNGQQTKYATSRGGSYRTPNALTGIFSAYHIFSPDSKLSVNGFRCMYTIERGFIKKLLDDNNVKL